MLKEVAWQVPTALPPMHLYEPALQPEPELQADGLVSGVGTGVTHMLEQKLFVKAAELHVADDGPDRHR